MTWMPYIGGQSEPEASSPMAKPQVCFHSSHSLPETNLPFGSLQMPSLSSLQAELAPAGSMRLAAPPHP
eukprot:CAMPEP_0184312988 /NCGR_PEP_ID=MMETSP1049-20130417/57831_1 /TAXON_ID=77928 /ORGANISM="Proteomonas sulcata, Strain CCMP704" /LENGTH=68 /DNA_ID=CAMNT_0026629759 /DNA_START=77 /DNA_END=279 /DNA_ORIENTATION=+